MDFIGASERPSTGRRPPSPSSDTPIGGKAANTGQRHREMLSPFHRSPIVNSDGVIRSRRPGAASGKLLMSPDGLFQDSPGPLIALPAAASSVEHAPCRGSTTEAKVQASLACGRISVLKDL